MENNQKDFYFNYLSYLESILSDLNANIGTIEVDDFDYKKALKKIYEISQRILSENFESLKKIQAKLNDLQSKLKALLEKYRAEYEENPSISSQQVNRLKDLIDEIETEIEFFMHKRDRHMINNLEIEENISDFLENLYLQNNFEDNFANNVISQRSILERMNTPQARENQTQSLLNQKRLRVSYTNLRNDEDNEDLEDNTDINSIPNNEFCLFREIREEGKESLQRESNQNLRHENDNHSPTRNLNNNINNNINNRNINNNNINNRNNNIINANINLNNRNNNVNNNLNYDSINNNNNNISSNRSSNSNSGNNVDIDRERSSRPSNVYGNRYLSIQGNFMLLTCRKLH